jgi:hypothetical protein
MRPLMNSALFKYFFLMLFALLVVAPGASSVAAVLAARVAQAGSRRPAETMPCLVRCHPSNLPRPLLTWRTLPGAQGWCRLRTLRTR